MLFGPCAEGALAPFLSSLLWAVSAAALICAPLLVVASVWLYTLVFAFAACWFAHYTLAALQRLRATPVPQPDPIPVTSLSPSIERLPPP